MVSPSDHHHNHLERIMGPQTSQLPPELLSAVFVFTGITKGNAHTHITLARVCKTWRSIIYSNPRFWTALTFTFQRGLAPGAQVRCDKDVVQYLEAWFRRANDLPLTLNLIMEPTHCSDPSNLPDLEALTSFLVKTPRWKALSLLLVCKNELERPKKWEWLSRLFAVAKKQSRKQRAPCWASLQSLEITAKGVEFRSPERLPLHKIAPHLQHLKVEVNTIKKADTLTELFVNANAANIRSIEIDAKIYQGNGKVISDFWLPTLFRATRLESFKLTDRGTGSEVCSPQAWSPRVSSKLPVIPVPNSTLRHLSVHDSPSMRAILQHVSLPSLTSLGLSANWMAGVMRWDVSLVGAVERLIEHSHCEITHLRLTNTPSPSEITPLLCLFPHVETLEIIITMSLLGCRDTSLQVGDALYQSTLPPRDLRHACILPHLRNFYLKAPCVANASVERFVESPRRWWSDDSASRATVAEVGTGSSTLQEVGGYQAEQALALPRYARLENVLAIRSIPARFPWCAVLSTSTTLQEVGGYKAEQALTLSRYARLEDVPAVESRGEYVSTIYSRGKWEGTEY